MGFQLGQTVFLKTDEEQRPNIVICKNHLFGGTVIYSIACDGARIDVYECELSDRPDELLLLGIREKGDNYAESK